MHEWARDLAIELIGENGRPMKLVETGSSHELNPVITETLTDVIGLQTTYKAEEVDGVNILATHFKILLDSTVEPDRNMIIRDGDKNYSIIDYVEIKPSDTSILYKVQASL